MIRIRTGTAWRHDPRLPAMLRRVRAGGQAAVQSIVDALAIEVDGVDIAAGRAEGPLLPSLEALLRALARVLGGAPHATVAFPDGGLELVVRRRGASALLTVVSVARPSRVLARDVEVDLEALSAAAPGELPRGSETILLVEDEVAVRDAVRSLLARLGYQVIAAKDGADALDRIRRDRTLALDLLLTDVVMPGMNGRELAARLRAQHPGAGVLFMSGYAHDVFAPGEVLDEAVDLVAKPFSPEALARRVREALDRRAGAAGAAAR